MNERIRELEKQATEEVMRNTPSFLVTNEMWKEKFAELIVRECTDVVLQWKSEPFPMDPEFAARLIKEHFGVEE